GGPRRAGGHVRGAWGPARDRPRGGEVPTERRAPRPRRVTAPGRAGLRHRVPATRDTAPAGGARARLPRTGRARDAGSPGGRADPDLERQASRRALVTPRGTGRATLRAP